MVTHAMASLASMGDQGRSRVMWRMVYMGGYGAQVRNLRNLALPMLSDMIGEKYSSSSQPSQEFVIPGRKFSGSLQRFTQ